MHWLSSSPSRPDFEQQESSRYRPLPVHPHGYISLLMQLSRDKNVVIHQRVLAEKNVRRCSDDRILCGGTSGYHRK